MAIEPYDLDQIEHIRGVDHPESISIGPNGKAYTTGTGGQVYRINLADNVAVQFASTAPWRMLRQAVDADSRLYCADTTGKVIRIMPTGEESTYATGPGGEDFLCTNYLAFDRAGNMYLSNSGDLSGQINGRLYKIPPGGGEAELWYLEAVDTPNAIALGAQKRYLYFVETFGGNICRVAIAEDGSAGVRERVVHMPRHIPDGIAFDERGWLRIACHRPDAIYVFDLTSNRLDLFAEDWRGEALRGPMDVAFAGPNRDILLAASLDNLVVHRFNDVGVCGLQLNNPTL